jgi:hypothetical protein
VFANDLLAIITRCIAERGNCKLEASTVDSPDAPPYGMVRLRVEGGDHIADIPVHQWTGMLHATTGQTWWRHAV